MEDYLTNTIYQYAVTESYSHFLVNTLLYPLWGEEAHALNGLNTCLPLFTTKGQGPIYSSFIDHDFIYQSKSQNGVMLIW